MTLEERKRTALARLRSPTGHLSATIPKSIAFEGDTLELWNIVDKERNDLLPDAEETRYIAVLRGYIAQAEKDISNAKSEDVVNAILEDALGAKRVLSLFEKKKIEHKHIHSHSKREDAKRWLGFSKEIKGR